LGVEAPITLSKPAAKEKLEAAQVITLNFDFKAGTEHFIWLGSDLHFDNPHCDRKKLKRQLDEAKERNALIKLNGDTLCAMQGKNDRRHSRKDLGPGQCVEDYFDEIVEEAVEFLKPYLHLIAVIRPGNHESAVLKHNSTDLTKRLVKRLRELGSPVQLGTYAGYVQLRCTTNKTKTFTINMFQHHGYGGGGAVTKGVIQANRMAVYLPDAHIIHTGHIHEKWIMYNTRDRINTSGGRFLDEQQHVCTPGFKEEYGCGEGFHVEKGRPPKPTGGAWLRLFTIPNETCETGRVGYEVSWA
jgi:hypothetical protein